MAKRRKAAAKAKLRKAKSKQKPRVARGKPFQLEESTIDDLHRAIKAGRTTVVAVVQHYIERVRKYNGVASVLVTEDGKPLAAANGTVRGQAPLRFPTETVKAADVLPDLDQYRGPPLEFGRMEPTASDAAAQQQFGMIAGIKNGTQLNALATLNRPPGAPPWAGTGSGLRPPPLPAHGRKSGQFMCYRTGQI